MTPHEQYAFAKRPGKALGCAGVSPRWGVVTGLLVAQLAVVLACPNLFGSVDPAQSLRPVITDGLVHYWPDPWNARDEITGKEGTLMALLPEGSAGGQEPIQFGPAIGWVQLRASQLPPAFTISCWLRWEDQNANVPVVLWCEGEGRRWVLQQNLPEASGAFGVVTDEPDEGERAEFFHITEKAWHHLALVQDGAGRLRVWVDGRQVVSGTTQRQALPSPEWLTVGNSPKGDQQWTGLLRDLAWYARPLTEAEVEALYQAGRSVVPPERSDARRRAAGRKAEPEWSTDVARVSVASMDHRRYTSEDNLPGNNIQALLQGRDGFLWVGTEYGLARFDGSRFLSFGLENTPAMEIVGCDISCLAEDGSGTVWAGLFGGLLRIRGVEATAVTNGLPERFVLRVEPSGSNALWLAAYHTGGSHRGACRLRRYIPATGETTACTLLPGQVRRLVDTPEGVWIATEQPEMILFWDGRAPAPQVRLKVIGTEELVFGSADESASVSACLRGWRDPSQPGGCWVEIQFGAEGPVFHWLARPGVPEAHLGRWSSGLLPPAWVAAGRGLAHSAGKTLRLLEFPGRLLQPEVEALCANQEGGVWVGTIEDGLHLVRERPLKVVSVADGLADNDVRSVRRSSRGGAWVATRGGVHHWLSGVATFVAPGQPRCLAEDAAGRLWWGIQDSGYVILGYLSSEGPQSFRLPGLEWRGPSAIHFARDGTMWVVCEAGVTWVKPEWLPGNQRLASEYDEKSGFGRFRRGIELPDSEPIGLVEDHEGAVWVGSMDRGLYRIRGGEVQIRGRAQGFPGALALPVWEDSSDALWILSDTGIVRRRNGRFDLFDRARGAPRDLFFGMVEDQHGSFWFPGSHGIHQLLRADVEACLDGRLIHAPNRTFGLRDGMLTPECSAVGVPGSALLADGNVAVATRNGLVLIDPARAEPNNSVLPVIFEKVVANRRAIPITPLAEGTRSPALAADSATRWLGGVELPGGSGRRLEIHYTAVSLLAADRVRFRYRLEGQDKNWSEETSQRIAFYSNLQPGRYQFRVQSSKAPGAWPEEEWLLGLLIHPYFWQTRLFQAAAALAVLGAALLLHRQRLRTLRVVQELRHRQQFTGERARIAADMHDDLGAALTQIAILGEVAKRQLADAPQAAPLLDRISQSARDVTSRMSDLVWATNPRNDSLDNLSAHLREHAARMLQDAPVRAHLAFPTSVPVAHLSAMVRRNVLLVMKEGITNALRHAGPTEIRVTFGVESGGFQLTLEDNGRGFDPGRPGRAGNGGNGLGNMRRRIAEVGGRYELVSAPGKGTRIQLWVPGPVPPSRAGITLV